MSNGRKIILHIGANKTGSSAIQRFLALNVEALRKEGIVVPGTNFEIADRIAGFHVWSFQKLFESPVEGRKSLEAALAAIFEAVPDRSTVLLSAENLAADPGAPSLFENLVREHDIEVILYVRRQDEYILSTWQQWNSKVSDDFWAWALVVAGTTGNWKLYLQNWEKIIPREKIKVRVFDRTKLEGGDVIVDFFKLLGVGATFESFAYPEKRVNPSFADAVMELVKGNELIFENAHDNKFYHFVEKLTGDRYFKNDRESFLTYAQRGAILQKYAASNRWVKDNYFSAGEGDLFTPLEQGEYMYVNAEAVKQRQLEFLTTLVYRLYLQQGKE